MKKIILISLTVASVFMACKKHDNDSISLTASTTNITVGQSVDFTVVSNDNNDVYSWSSNPETGVVKQFNVTSNKQNTITFNEAGTYVIGVRERKMHFGTHHNDSTWQHHGIDSAFHHHGGHQGKCNKGKDSAAVVIRVK